MTQNAAEQRGMDRTETREGLGAEPRPFRDPFRHGDLPQRPNYLPEEGESGRSDFWAIIKGVVIAISFIALVAWLLTLR